MYTWIDRITDLIILLILFVPFYNIVKKLH